MKGNTYIVTELDRVVAKLCIVAFCLIPYFLYSYLTVLILCLIKAVELTLEGVEPYRISCKDTDDLDNCALDAILEVEPSTEVIDS